MSEIQAFGTPASPAAVIPDLKKEEVSVYPVPLSGVITLTGVVSGARVAMYTLQGFNVIESTGNTLDISFLKVRMYLLKANNSLCRFVKN